MILLIIKYTEISSCIVPLDRHYPHLTWNIGEFNERCHGGKLSQLVPRSLVDHRAVHLQFSKPCYQFRNTAGKELEISRWLGSWFLSTGEFLQIGSWSITKVLVVSRLWGLFTWWYYCLTVTWSFSFTQFSWFIEWISTGYI